MFQSKTTKIIAWRLVQLPFILFAVYTITFLLAWQIPGNPLEKEGRRPPKEVMEAMESQYNLNDPLRVLFGVCVGRVRVSVGVWKPRWTNL